VRGNRRARQGNPGRALPAFSINPSVTRGLVCQKERKKIVAFSPPRFNQAVLVRATEKNSMHPVSKPVFKISSKFPEISEISTISRVGEFFAFRSKKFGWFKFLCKKEHGSVCVNMCSNSAVVGQFSSDH
jgi:hypothetical protein